MLNLANMKFKYTSLVILAAGLFIAGCKEDEDKDFVDPYSGGKAPLGIVTNAQQIPVPESGDVGTTVTIAATGLEDYYKKLLERFPEKYQNIEKKFGISFSEAKDFVFKQIKNNIINDEISKLETATKKTK